MSQKYIRLGMTMDVPPRGREGDGGRKMARVTDTNLTGSERSLLIAANRRPHGYGSGLMDNNGTLYVFAGNPLAVIEAALEKAGIGASVSTAHIGRASYV